ncbi:MAG TPA: hypothetical protein VLJ39_20090 [Tepidisphaeraceae bacterium]|nr:hypothetical protein [Tepidisphaeraceae bacterium]
MRTARFRSLLAALLAAWLMASFASTARAADDALLARIDASLESAGKFLVAQQTPGGAWKSGVYGPFKDGPSLSPQVLASLCAIPGAEKNDAEAIRRGREYLRTLVHSQRKTEASRPFSIYTAALCLRLTAAAGPGEKLADDREFWLRFIRNEQLNAASLWAPSDPSFGGWSYAIGPPLKPGPGHTGNGLAFGNISATAYALAALRVARFEDQATFSAASAFVERCQNYSDDSANADPAFDDGGFFFTPDSPAWNKAGPAGADRTGRTRFHSYGAATADGLKALRDAGLPPDHPRAVAARHWLESHFDPASNPGTFEPDRKVLQNATFFYYAASVSRALSQSGDAEWKTPTGTRKWAEELASELMRRQRGDGSWANEFTDSKEDDPLIATPHAISALGACLAALAR